MTAFSSVDERPRRRLYVEIGSFKNRYPSVNALHVSHCSISDLCFSPMSLGICSWLEKRSAWRLFAAGCCNEDDMI